MCIICNENKDEKLKPYISSTWDTIKRAAAKRLLLTSDCYKSTTTKVNMMQDKGSANYHSGCHKNYIAVKKPSEAVSKSPAKKPMTRCRSSMPPSDERGLLKGSCIFCPTLRKTVKGRIEPLSKCSVDVPCERLFATAPHSTNERLKAIISTLTDFTDLHSKEAQYHKSCWRAFHNKKENERAVKPPATTSGFSCRQQHFQTFAAISALIEEEILGKSRAMLSSSLLELYKTEFLDAGGMGDDIESYTTQALMNKIKEKFKEKILISLYDRRRGNFVYSSALSEADARESLQDDEEKHFQLIRTAALHLRSIINAMPKWRTPTPTTVDSLKQVSPDIPEEVTLFYKTLLCGLREPYGDEALDRKIMAMSSDAIYNTTRGAVRPWKHSALGLGLGSLTGSKLVLRILNRLGNSISYDEVKALETEFAYSAEGNAGDAPDGLELNGLRGTGLAFDNYDVNIDTIDGKDTLHATVGICYQNVGSFQLLDPQALATRSGRNRRQFLGRDREIAPYHKQLKRARFNLTEPNDPKKVTLQVIDFYWLLQAEVDKPLPLFPGYYSQFVQDQLPQQRIWYMDPISAPPTRNDVVRETMKRSMNVAAETQQKCGIVTYDLAVALKAYSIQALDAPVFDNLLILLGNFHLELAFFGAVGTFINESGAEYLLTEAGVLAEGSLMGFIRGKYYNRCVRIHSILALVMERKLYERFLQTLPQEAKDDMKDVLAEVPEDIETQEQFLSSHPLFMEHMQQFDLFFDKVMDGELGPTAQYWSMYIYMINRVHRDLMRGVRTNNIRHYIDVLPAVIDVFFALNRTNYARWGVLFLNKLETASPQSLSVLQAGAFSIRRTEKHYSRSAIDLTLEQTVNRDAASPMRGIVGFHHSQNAIRRWCITSTQRGMSVTELRNMTGLETVEQPTTQLRQNRVQKDSQHRDVLLKAVTEMCDPFAASTSTSACLLNIATGKAASEKTQLYLLGTIAAGKERHIKFREECASDQERFLKPIKRRKVENFAYDNSRKQQKDKGKPAAESLRDAFIRILVAVSQKTDFSLRYVMTFPITKYPLAIAHSDGSSLKTVKSKLLDKLEGLQDGFDQTPLPPISATLIDGGLLIHSFLSAIGRITTYGSLARSLLTHVCRSLGYEIHILFDTYQASSLKESERNLRGADDRQIVISGPEQSPKQSCEKLLKNGVFKDELAKFFLKEWQEDKFAPILGSKVLVVSYGGFCVRIKAEDDIKTIVEYPVSFQCTHEEADTLVAYHASRVSGNIVVRASDTDILVILLGMLGQSETRERLLLCGKVIMDCGSGNNRRHIDVSAIATALDTKRNGLAAAIPGLHAFTGSDFTAAFYRKGKVKPFEILEKDISGNYISFFAKLSTEEIPDQTKAEEFVCALYGMKSLRDVNKARFAKLCQMTGDIDQVFLCFQS